MVTRENLGITFFDTRLIKTGTAIKDRSIVGKARRVVLNLDGAVTAEVSPYDVLDVEGWLEPYSVLFSNAEGKLSEVALKTLGEDFVFSMNTLILDRLDILPEYRGAQLGLRFIEAAVANCRTGCRIAAMKPYPLQHESSDQSRNERREHLALHELSRNQKASTSSLKRYYGRVAFKSARGTDFMIRDLDVP
jgi:GNAT superfamily N-acetyltransferase